MKTIQLITLILLTHTVFGQTHQVIGSYEKTKDFNQPHDTYFHNDRVLLNYSPYVPVTNLSLIKFGLYQHAPLQTNGTFTDKKIPIKEGIVQNSFYSGDTITEFVIYYSKGFPKYECKFALRRRSLQSMELFGNELILATHEFVDVSEYHYMNVFHNGLDFVFVESLKSGCKITFLSNHLEVTNKLELDNQSYSTGSDARLFALKYNKDGSLLMLSPNFPYEDPALKLVKNKIIHINAEGTIHSFTTSFEESTVMSIGLGVYQYDAEKEEISWTYQLKSMDKTPQYGFGVAKWRIDGRLLYNSTTFLDFETMFKNEPQIVEEFKSRKLPYDKIWDDFGNIYRETHNNEDYIFITRPTLYPSQFTSALYVIKLDEDGQMKWFKPLFSIIMGYQIGYSPKPYFKNGKLHVILADLTVNLKDRSHVNNPFKRRDGEITFFDITLNSEDGSEESNYQLDLSIPAEQDLNLFSVDQKKLTALVGLAAGKTITYHTFDLK
ncbi:MAG: hypothetical protein ACO1N0_16885 [Fluviicola sp.]